MTDRFPWSWGFVVLGQARWKKEAGHPTAPRYEEFTTEALCFGWIDSTARSYDDTKSLIWMSPRRPGSGWSAVNKRRIEEAEAAGLMAAPGRAAIDRAKADGSWCVPAAARLLLPALATA